MLINIHFYNDLAQGCLTCKPLGATCSGGCRPQATRLRFEQMLLPALTPLHACTDTCPTTALHDPCPPAGGPELTLSNSCHTTNPPWARGMKQQPEEEVGIQRLQQLLQVEQWWKQQQLGGGLETTT